ncbi:MAG TPA: GNAT family N-acetyltransferase [Amnibacterium sp.]|uniref:GNAT family N-acetyltransferase n=1 Tax=Amnibacterium sp. TaxID=1872496 RepID=UPI002F91CA05
MTVTIKPLAERDFFAWYALFTEYATSADIQLTDEHAMRVWTKLQSDDAHAVVATDEGGDTVGLVHFVVLDRLLQGDSTVLIEDLYVAEHARRAGVATALVEHVRTRAEDEGRAAVRWVSRPDDPAAKALHDKFAASAGGWVLHDLPVG